MGVEPRPLPSTIFLREEEVPFDDITCGSLSLQQFEYNFFFFFVMNNDNFIEKR
jgi:hypothetical protein